MRFAFYGRVSTEDQQDPESSRGWQLARSRQLIEAVGGEIVVEFFDVGQSRSLPWKRRPEAAALLAALKDPARGFGAVVVGELARAFGDNMDREHVMRLLDHYGVDLWHPDAAGRHDRTNIGHRITASLRAELAAEERATMVRRVKSAMADQVERHGRFMGGRPPYGYRLVDAGPHPNPAKASDGKRLHRLEVDPVAAPIVARIFAEYVAGRGLYMIAEGLTRDGIPSPAAYDPARNVGRQPNPAGAWSKNSVRAIIKNPRYTGREVWGKQARFDELVDVEDVAAGNRQRMRWNPVEAWTESHERVNEAIIDDDLFDRAQQAMRAGQHRPLEPKRRRTQRRYLLSGLVTCGLCGRRMQAQTNHGQPHYRCRYLAEFAAANALEHPTNVYLREEAVVPAIDSWLAASLTKDAEATIEALLSAGPVDEAVEAKATAARRTVDDCTTRIERLVRSIEDGTASQAIVGARLRELEGQRLAAQRELAAARPAERMTVAEAKRLVQDVRQVARKLAKADPDLKAELYAELGLRIEYRPSEQVVSVELPLVGFSACRRGDLNSP